MDREWYDLLMRKYAAVWVWSIIVGLNSGVAFTIGNYRPDRWGSIGLILMVPQLAAILFSATAWFYVLRTFRAVVAPLVLYGKTVEEIMADKEARSLGLADALFFSILAIVSVMCGAVFQTLVSVAIS